MEIAKQQIIEIGLAIVRDIYNKEFNNSTAGASEYNLSIFEPGNNEYYYKHKGWVFSVESMDLYGMKLCSI